MPSSLAGKVVLITGASSGIGWALAKELAAEGCKLGLAARREQPLRTLAAEIAAAGGTAAVAVADVSNRESIETGIASLRAALGPIDIAIANAGIGRSTLLNPVNVADVENTFRTNLFGVIYTLSAVLPEMLARRSGHIVAISSLAGYRGLPGESAYCASKAAVNSYMDGLRIHLRGSGVAATTICPGFIVTPMTAKMNAREMPGLMSADAAAKKMVRAIRRRKKVYSFPARVHFLVKLSRWAPDWMIQRVMGKYNENSRKKLVEMGSRPT
ncbi:MAG TPA: SDR family NAD(P)-dependent oxidoreductase [Urbifossiella sp.]|nr:SDR family NAD(P)-dependent oxidoreductase [Urbifossiella sp.]